MKKTLSLLNAILFVFSAFGMTTVFGGIISGAEFLDYFEYVPIPGFNAFSEAGLKSINATKYEFVRFSSENKPEGSAADTLAEFKVLSLDSYNGVDIWTFNSRNRLTEESAQWSAKDTIDGKTIFGDTGMNFESAAGITFWVGVNGIPYTSDIGLTAFIAPSKGPYYSVSEDNDEQDMLESAYGFTFQVRGKRPDADGYVYFDFKTDFRQVDWWSVDDEGVNHYGEQDNRPLPKHIMSAMNAFTIRVSTLQANDIVTIGDFRVCYDTRIHTDELDEQISRFDSLDPEAYTEESYAAASEIYLEAYEMYLNPPSTQRDIDRISEALKEAIKNLKPLFHARHESIFIEGFDVWSEDDLDSISAAGLDSAILTNDYAPYGKESSIMVMANAVNGEPTYGWSWFTSGAEEGDSVTAIGNPFALKEGSEPLSESNGIRFWIKWDETLEPIPVAARVGIGSSSENVYFECEDYTYILPESEGYIGCPWTSFFDINGEAEIYDYIDTLDYISIFIEGAVGIYYISDLHAFAWSISEADFDPLRQKVNETYAYMATLTKSDWYYKSWERVMDALSEAEKLIDAYGVTEEQVREAIDNIDSALRKLVKRDELATAETIAKLEALSKAADTYWRGNVTPASYREMLEVNEATKVMIDDGPSEVAAQEQITLLDAKIKGLVPITAGGKVTSIYSFEEFSVREFGRVDGQRNSFIEYTLAAAAEIPNIPEGYAKALRMKVTPEYLSDIGEKKGVIALAPTNSKTGAPILIGKNNENLLIGDLSGTDGLCLWVGVNDPTLVQDGEIQVAVSNCTSGPLFERYCNSIQIPTTGHGWLYLPWEYFEDYDDWTNGEPINLSKIYFYIVRMFAHYSEGFEFYVTGIHAYKDTTEGEWETPVIENITEGQVIDVSDTPFVPKWSVGTAEYDNTWFEYGSEVYGNGEHTLTVNNGNKSTSVTFTVTGAQEIVYETPALEGVEEGGSYTSVTLNWTPEEATAVLNGQEVERGTEITEVGDYTLIITNGDKQLILNFSISDAPEYKKGDFDFDGEITVADALAALRIAARMAESSDEAIAIGDIDADGEITVADALAILRVAARMSDSL